MILKGSQRGGAGQLANHLLNKLDNDHITLQEVRGFVADDLHGALAEAHAVSKGTRCTQYLFSLSVNPPDGSAATKEDLIAAADRAGQALGLADQPRAIVFHEKTSDRRSVGLHAHVVWSRIDAQDMKAINLPFFKNKLKELSKELFLEHGWQLPDGYRTNGWANPLNFSLAEYQQAKRLDLDPREVKQALQEAWHQSDNLKSFRNALEERGFYLARGDRRGFVALDVRDELKANDRAGPLSLSRWLKVSSKDLEQRLGKPDKLPGLAEVRKDIRSRINTRLREHVRRDRKNKTEELQPLLQERARMLTAHRAERETLREGQEKRWHIETKARSQKLRKGIRGLVDFITGRAAAIRRQNEQEAYKSYMRDRGQRESLFGVQGLERESLDERIVAIRTRHRQERMQLARGIAQAWRRDRDPVELHREQSRTPEPGLDM